MTAARIACGALMLAATCALADERILAYESEVTINADSTLVVSETIRVRAEGEKIRRGIYRDFPTVYTSRDGRRVTTGFDLLGVQRDGVSEPHRVERLQNGVRIYAGDADVYLSPGEYTYELRYRTDRQLGYFETHDELYWNVTGTGWQLPIDQATAVVHLPAGTPAADLRLEAYTGPQGARGADYDAGLEDGTPVFTTTRALRPYEGLTIVVSWPKGHAAPPSAAAAYRYALRDSRPLAIAVSGLLLVLLYYFVAWLRVGRDPPGRVVVPQYEPPPGQSPASMRYLMRMRYDDRCFAAAVLSLAVKGHLTIGQHKSGLLGLGNEYVLSRVRDPQKPQPMSEDEAALMKTLFAGGRSSLELKDENHAIVSEARSRQRSLLKGKLTPGFFRINGGWHALGVILSVAVGALSIWRSIAEHFPPEWFIFTLHGQLTLLALLVMLLANGICGRLLKAPSVGGRELMDRIEGFRLYLDVTEGDQLAAEAEPRLLTPSLFETYLPAALALGVEQQWAERFAEVFATRPQSSSAPEWYRGTRWNAGNLSGFSTSLGSSLSSAITSSATAPGSSSGSSSGGGGGGSSGGGGGGGGGGGW